ncbi:TMEM43 family protein [Candidatus Parabeggiatoa sp. HSG14]|uniref:TMEM43 family protein n=1 Tax=Candidatus Parabeggiatoa sp. HSG14 TaxID=3055593 RepID=UPI0025A8F9DF|nr:TMEM43 family protein [Thiotrichales bacterium HSG14]
MANTYTEVTQESWGNRLKSSLQAALIGFVLFFGAFYLLFWNEGRSVNLAKTLEEGERAVISEDAYFINPNNEGELIHLTGKATTDETLTDAIFGVISPNTIKLQRIVEMYQWEEKQSTETEEKLGGGIEKRTTYTYSKIWSEKSIDSNQFKQSAGHFNPPAMHVNKELLTTDEVKLGEFTLSTSLVGKMNKYQALPMTTDTLEKVPASLRSQFKNSTSALEESHDNFHLHQEKYYIGQNPNYPQIGDVQITFKVVLPETISVIAQQEGSSLVPHIIEKTGGEIELFEYGTASAKEMFEHEKMINTMLTWLLRLGGFLMMYTGLLMIFNVLKILVAVIPVLGNIVEFVGSLVAFIIATAFSIMTIAISWLFYRPMLGISLLVVAAVLLYLLKFLKKPQQGSTVSEEGGINWQFPNNRMNIPSFVSGNIWQSLNSKTNTSFLASGNKPPIHSISTCQSQRFNGGTLSALDHASNTFPKRNQSIKKTLVHQETVFETSGVAQQTYAHHKPNKLKPFPEDTRIVSNTSPLQPNTAVSHTSEGTLQALNRPKIQLNKDIGKVDNMSQLQNSDTRVQKAETRQNDLHKQLEKEKLEEDEELAEEALRANHALKLIGF